MALSLVPLRLILGQAKYKYICTDHLSQVIHNLIPLCKVIHDGNFGHIMFRSHIFNNVSTVCWVNMSGVPLSWVPISPPRFNMASNRQVHDVSLFDFHIHLRACCHSQCSSDSSVIVIQLLLRHVI